MIAEALDLKLKAVVHRITHLAITPTGPAEQYADHCIALAKPLSLSGANGLRYRAFGGGGDRQIREETLRVSVHGKRHT